MLTLLTYQEMSETPNRRGATLVVAHPNDRSLNHAIAAEAAKAVRSAGVDLSFHDLYAENFDAVLSKEEMLRRFSFDPSVQEHAAELKSRALLIIVHPDWWGQPPAVLKGWLDRVLRPGVAYDFSGPEFLDKEHVPLLTGMRAVVFATSNQQRPGDDEVPTLEQVWRKHVFDYCGIEPYEVKVFYDVRNSSRRTRKRWLRAVAEITARYAVGDDHPNNGPAGEQVPGGRPSGNVR